MSTAKKEKPVKAPKAKAEKRPAPKDILFEIIRTPVVTEKSTLQGQYNKVSFKVRTEATKAEVKEAVEAIWGVKVLTVNTIRQQGKIKRFKGHIGRRNEFKKAIVTLEEGQTIDVMGGIK
jgi:large subunit ribosomal protein L23